MEPRLFTQGIRSQIIFHANSLSVKVVTPKEMARTEKEAYVKGASDHFFMENAGRGVAEYIKAHFPKETKITLLCGKGNNAGDAFVAGRYLHEAGYTVEAYRPFPLEMCSSLCQEMAQRFLGKSVENFPESGILLDGLLGTGFKGQVEGVLLETIQKANQSKLPIFAIDIPSGLDGGTGAASPEAIKATATFFLGLPKKGFFFQDGFRHVGELIFVDFGMDARDAKGDYELITKAEAAMLLPEIVRERHKYEAGYVCGFTGSFEMPGAAFLSSTAALRAGCGIVRVWAFEENPLLIPEIIRGYIEKPSEVIAAMNKASAVYMGPGIGKHKSTVRLLKKLLVSIKAPLVLDADALNIISESELHLQIKNAILTPHAGEMKRLLKKEHFDHSDVQQFADKHEVFVVLKGAPTFIFSPHAIPFISAAGDAGMATAGTGDVLTGLIASFLAQGAKPLHAAKLGVFFHGLCGEIAALEKTSYALIASDLIAAFPLAFKELLQYKKQLS